MKECIIAQIARDSFTGADSGWSRKKPRNKD